MQAPFMRADRTYAVTTAIATLQTFEIHQLFCLFPGSFWRQERKPGAYAHAIILAGTTTTTVVAGIKLHISLHFIFGDVILQRSQMAGLLAH